MKRIQRHLLALFLLAGTASADVLFTLDPPSGFVAGASGASVGWGYTITTDFDHVSIESFVFNELGTPIGMFEAAGGVPSADITPTQPLMLPWQMDSSGLQYDIMPGLPVGAASEGTISVVYDAFDADFNQIVFGDVANAQQDGSDVLAEVFVNDVGSGPPSNTPEPNELPLIGAGLAVLLWTSYRLRRAPRFVIAQCPSELTKTNSAQDKF